MSPLSDLSARRHRKPRAVSSLAGDDWPEATVAETKVAQQMVEQGVVLFQCWEYVGISWNMLELVPRKCQHHLTSISMCHNMSICVSFHLRSWADTAATGSRSLFIICCTLVNVQGDASPVHGPENCLNSIGLLKPKLLLA